MSKEAKWEFPILEKFKDLRVADVCDGMDWMGLMDIGLVSREIKPITMGVKACGVALTARYIPTQRTIPTMSPEEYTEFVRDWYANVCTYKPVMDLIKPGNILVVDASGLEVGLWGSNNSLGAIARGATGIIVDGGCRDTYEVKLQKVPVYARHVARTMVQGRLEFESVNQPIMCGEVKVRPGDIVVADDDGVIVVPQEQAEDVAREALHELENDKIGRRKLYGKVGLELDETVL